MEPRHTQGIQKATSNDISFLDLDDRSRTHHKVQCHRRGGVCVLCVLLGFFHVRELRSTERQRNINETRSTRWSRDHSGSFEISKNMSSKKKKKQKKKQKKNKTRSIQRTQTPPRPRPLTLLCDLDLSSRSRKLMSLDVTYCIVT